MAGSQSPKSRTVEMSHNNGKNFTSFPIIPYGRNQYGACLVIVDDETVFYAGGYTSKNMRTVLKKKLLYIVHFFTADNARLYANTAFLNLTSQEWTSGPQMTTARWGHTCSLITKTNGDKEIVIVGGRSHTSSGSDPPNDNCTINDVITLRDVEILDLQTNTFRAGE